MLHVGKPCLYCPGKARLSQDCTTFLSCFVLCCHCFGLSSPRKEKIPSTRFFFSCASNCHILSLPLLLNVGRDSVDRSFKSALARILLLGFEVKVAPPFQLLSGVVGALLLWGLTFEGEEEPKSPNVHVGNDCCIRSDGNVLLDRGADSADGERELCDRRWSTCDGWFADLGENR